MDIDYSRVGTWCQKRREFEAFINYIRDKGIKTILEIGTEKGGTALIFAQIAECVITVDINDWKDRVIPGSPWERKITQVLGNSHDVSTLKEVRGLLPGGVCDLLFIDACHTLDDVKMDFELYSHLVRPGGFVAFHDILPHYHRDEPGALTGPLQRWDIINVCPLWEQLRLSRKHKEFVVADTVFDMCWGGIGLLEDFQCCS